MNLNKFKVSRGTLANHLGTLNGDWVFPAKDDEWNIARAFYSYCLDNNVLLNVTNPDHFEHFLHTPQGTGHINRRFRLGGGRIRSDSAKFGVARKVWLEYLFSPRLLQTAGFKITPRAVIEWGTSDESLSTFSQGNHPYDNAANFLRETSVSHSSTIRERFLDTIIDDLWGKNTFERYRNMSHDGHINPSGISKKLYNNISDFKAAVRKRWAEFIPYSKIGENELFTLVLRWIYSNSGIYDPRTRIVLPPSEEKDKTLLLEVTRGCQWNKCTFCNFYKDVPYSVKDISEVKQQADLVKKILEDNSIKINRIFLACGDSLSAEYPHLLEIIKYAKDTFPMIDRVSTYASTGSILKHGSEKLKALKEEGLTIVYWGIETGSDNLRRFVRKSGTANDLHQAGEELAKSGINLSAMIMIGLGGEQYYEAHVKETANVLNRLHPRYIAFLNTEAYPGTPYEKMSKEIITPLDDIKALQQTKDIINSLDDFETTLSMSPLFVSNNPINSLRLVTNDPRKFSAKQAASEALEARIDFLKGAGYRRLFPLYFS